MVKKNFTRRELTKRIYQNIGFSKNFSSNIIDDFFEILTQNLLKSGQIKISSFGTFKVINKRKRIGRNPKTKVEAIIEPRKVVKFIPSSSMKKKINR